MSKALDDVIAERARQVNEEGWTPEHDDRHSPGDLAEAAACYLLYPSFLKILPYGDGTVCTLFDIIWPWSLDWWKPKDRRRDLVKAGALILAEIERIDRAALKGASHE